VGNIEVGSNHHGAWADSSRDGGCMQTETLTIMFRYVVIHGLIFLCVLK